MKGQVRDERLFRDKEIWKKYSIKKVIFIMICPKKELRKRP